jgi:hypothetical protein
MLTTAVLHMPISAHANNANVGDDFTWDNDVCHPHVFFVCL